MNRLHTMARFAEPDEPKREFICGGCGYAFSMPDESDDAHACDCGLDLCPDCRECAQCKKARELDEDNARANKILAYALGLDDIGQRPKI